MKRRALLAAVSLAIAMPAASSSSASPGASVGGIAGARALRACAAAGPYWPTMTLALAGKAAWVACKEQSRLVRLALPSGRSTGGVRLDAPVTAVAAGLSSLWALDTNSTLYRLDARTGRVRRRIHLDAVAAYNIWIGGGSVWVADDQGASVLRIAPSRNKVVAHVPVGDGPADVAFAGTQAWVVTHRDNTIFHVDLARNTATRVATLGGANAAVERLALLGGSLWATGRGAPLYELDPATGATRRSVDIGGTGIDVVATAGALWVPVRTAAVDRTGFPTMTAVRRVARDGAVTTVAKARGRVDVHGLAAGLGAIWLADNTTGVVYRLPT
jgi:hypothetical protein